MVSILSFELLISAWWDPILVLIYDSLLSIDVELMTLDQCVYAYLPSFVVKKPLKYFFTILSSVYILYVVSDFFLLFPCNYFIDFNVIFTHLLILSLDSFSSLLR